VGSGNKTERPEGFLDIFVYTAETPHKTYGVIDQLVPRLSPEVRVVVVHAADSGNAPKDFGSHVSFHHIPGEPAIGLRALMPAFTADVEWVCILEDHVHVDAGWLDGLLSELRSTPDDVTALIGSACNLTSLEPWSWANFLNVQAFHWTPTLVEPLQPLGFNMAFRRRLLPRHALGHGEFELTCVQDCMANPRGSTNFVANHVQHRFLPEVLYYHYANGRVTGAAMRQYHSGGMLHVFRHALHNAGRRRRTVDRLIREHDLFPNLPRGTRWRVQILALCHSAGAVIGGLAGAGRTPWALE
jgi:hypothetical protein